MGGALVLVASSLAACANYSGTPRQQLQSWASQAGYSADVAQINSDLTDLQNGLKLHQLLPLRTACEGFGTDAETLYGELPTPNQTITNELGDAMSDFFSAARQCYDAPSFTSSQFRSYQETMRKAEALYDEARKHLADNGVR